MVVVGKLLGAEFCACSELCLTGLTALGGYEDNTVGCAGTVNGSCSSILQDGDGLDVVRVDESSVGTATCTIGRYLTVIVSDERISSPILSKYDIAIVLNQPSLEKFEPKIKPGGILIYDGFGIINPPTRKDITIYRIDAMDKAAEMKNSKVFNMIVLGGLLKVAPVVSSKGVEKALFKTLPERHHSLIPLNMQAVEEGGKIIQEIGGK